MKPIGTYFLGCNRSVRYAMMLLLLVIACAATRLHAQGYASIVGTVTDPTGAVIPSATVTAVQTQTGHATVVTAAKDGAYVFPALLPSTYSISVSAQGFEKSTQGGIVLEADQSLTVNAKLKIGAATTDRGGRTSVPQVDTTTGTLSQVIDQQRVVDMPLNGTQRGLAHHAGRRRSRCHQRGQRCQPGQRKNILRRSPVRSATVNGTLPNQDNFLLDGGNNVDEMTNVNGPYPMPDACRNSASRPATTTRSSARAPARSSTSSPNRAANSSTAICFEYLRNGYFNAKPLLRHGRRTPCTAISSAAPSAARSRSRTSPAARPRSSSSAISTR